jgi:hypothetical protein
MKYLKALFLFLIIVNCSYAQQSFRINDFPRVFHGSISNNFDKKINDTVTLHGVYKSPNYQLSLVKANGTIICSCLYSLNQAVETNSSRDSTVQVKVLEPVSDNCIKKYRHLVDRKLQ